MWNFSIFSSRRIKNILIRERHEKKMCSIVTVFVVLAFAAIMVHTNDYELNVRDRKSFDQVMASHSSHKALDYIKPWIINYYSKLKKTRWNQMRWVWSLELANFSRIVN